MSEDDEKDETQTPPWLFKALDAEFHFGLDAFASEANALCPRFIDRAMDAYATNWAAVKDNPELAIFANPPYSELKKAIPKMADAGKASVVVGLFPPGVCSKAWHECVMRCAAEVRFPNKRIQFLRNGKPILTADGRRRSNDRDSAVVVWRPGIHGPTWTSMDVDALRRLYE